MPTTAPTITRKPADRDAAVVLDELRATLARLETRYAGNAKQYAAAGADLAVTGMHARLNLIGDLFDLIGR